MEALELPDKLFYVAVQFHPEYLSRPLRPSPPYVGLLAASSGQLERFVTEAKNKNGTVSRDSGTRSAQHEEEELHIAMSDLELEMNASLFD